MFSGNNAWIEGCGVFGDGLRSLLNPIERVRGQRASYLQVPVEDGLHLPVEFLRARSMGSWLRLDHGRVQAERSD
jgi:hypothetical protein